MCTTIEAFNWRTHSLKYVAIKVNESIECTWQQSQNYDRDGKFQSNKYEILARKMIIINFKPNEHFVFDLMAISNRSVFEITSKDSRQKHSNEDEINPFRWPRFSGCFKPVWKGCEKSRQSSFECWACRWLPALPLPLLLCRKWWWWWWLFIWLETPGNSHQ